MSVKSGIWVEAHMRRCQFHGLMVTLARKGAQEAGAIYVRALLPSGRVRLFGPPMGPAHDAQGNRRFSLPLGQEPVPESASDAYLARQATYDPDIWVLDAEDREGQALLADYAIDL